MQWRH